MYIPGGEPGALGSEEPKEIAPTLAELAPSVVMKGFPSPPVDPNTAPTVPLPIVLRAVWHYRIGKPSELQTFFPGAPLALEEFEDLAGYGLLVSNTLNYLLK